VKNYDSINIEKVDNGFIIDVTSPDFTKTYVFVGEYEVIEYLKELMLSGDK